MNITIITHEFPFPPNHGGRVDIWNRILGFKKLGYRVMLITWMEATEINRSAPLLSKVRNTVDCLKIFPIRRDLKRIINNIIRYPSIVSSRLLNGNETKQLVQTVRKFSCDLIFIDGIYAGIAGVEISKALSVPVALRLHNIEHVYMRGQLSMASSLRGKFQIIRALFHLKYFEERIVSSVDVFFDISKNGLSYWKSKGLHNGYWLLPTYNDSLQRTDRVVEKDFDIGFIGNLYAPNNVNGLFWFMNHVLNVIRSEFQNLRIVFIGSNPTDEIIEKCKNSKIELIANPESLLPYLETINVLINPVQFGSGVNIKAIDMIFSDNQVVSTSVGVGGLPEEISDVFFVADSSVDFANSIVNVLKKKEVKSMEKREQLRSLFGINSLDRAMKLIDCNR